MAPWTTRRGSQPSSSRDLIDRAHNTTLDPPSSLLGRFNLSDAHVNLDPSSSDPESLSPRAKNRRSHGRSASQPFPSFFGGKKQRRLSRERRATDTDGTDDEITMPGQSMKTQKQGSQNGTKDFATGNCMTCGSLVRWPKGLNVFKCTICTTINDLGPLGAWQNGIGEREGSASKRRAPGKGQSKPSHPISLDRSHNLVQQCLRSYIFKRVCRTLDECEDLGNGETRLPNVSNQLSAVGYVGVVRQRGVERHDSNLAPCTYTPQYHFDEEPSLRPSPGKPASSPTRPYVKQNSGYSKPLGETEPDVRRHNRSEGSAAKVCEPKRIFKLVEDYVVDCFSCVEGINTSFLCSSSRHPTKTGKETIKRKPVLGRDTQASKPLPDIPREKKHADVNVCDLDPKLLLLGDFAENGTWWSGGQRDAPDPGASGSRSAESIVSTVTRKSPQVNWDELDRWYDLILNASRGWFSAYEEVSKCPEYVRPSESELRDIEKALLKAQEHLQRVLLKATETLLKRPGGKILHASGLRFLLIIMENPLIHTDARVFDGFLQQEPNDAGLQNGALKGRRDPVRSSLLSGQHSGIIKRVVGLLSNLSDECHNHFINWLARHPPTKFAKTKDLVFGFLTYRMRRQGEKKQEVKVDITAGLIPQMQAGRSGASLHDEIGSSNRARQAKSPSRNTSYSDDWQIKAACRVLSLLFTANNLTIVRLGDAAAMGADRARNIAARDGLHPNGQFLPATDFYSSMADYVDLITDFEAWESRKGKFSFCQYPFLLSIWAKTQILEYDARRQMESKARDAFFNSIMSRRAISQYLVLNVRRECLVDDSLKAVSEVVGSGGEDLKKGIRISFKGEEGIDGGGLRKEWFLLLVREVFNPDNGMFIYDEDSQYCYFNPNAFEASDQFFLVGLVMGLAIYNSTILDVALPPFAFRKLLSSAPQHSAGPSPHQRQVMKYTLEDLAEYRPRLARGLKQLLDFEGDVENTFCLDFMIEVDKYGTTMQVPLEAGGERKPVNNSNRREYVDLYVRYLLDTSVSRQFEPFKRGFYTVCGGNAFSLFQPEEIELLIRGSDEALDIASLRAVAEYDNWKTKEPDGSEPVVGWFWDSFEAASPRDQRLLLSFITGSDRLPATGASTMIIRIHCLGDGCGRYPVARTCFNLLSLWRYHSQGELENKLWRAVRDSEGFGLK